MPLPIRPATVTDAAPIAALIMDNMAANAAQLPQEFKPVGGANVYTAEAAAVMIAREKNVVLVAVIGGEVVGFAMGEYMRRSDTPTLRGRAMIYLYQLIVRPEHRRKGIGTALLEAVRNAAREKGTDLVMLEILGFNEPARAFFRRHGFSSYSERLWN